MEGLTKRVGACQTALRAQWVSLGGAQVVDLDDDTLSTREHCVIVVWVRLCGQLKAQSTRRACTGARTDAEKVLRSGSVVAWIGVPATGSRGGVAVGRAEGVALAIPRLEVQ